MLTDLQNFSRSRLLYSFAMCFVEVTVDWTINISAPAAMAILENFSACAGIQLTTAVPSLFLISFILLEISLSFMRVEYIDWINSVAFWGVAFEISSNTLSGFS